MKTEMTKEFIKWNKEIPAALQEILDKVTVEFARIDLERMERQKDLDQIESLKKELDALAMDFALAVEANKQLSAKNHALECIIRDVKNVVKNV